MQGYNYQGVGFVRVKGYESHEEEVKGLVWSAELITVHSGLEQKGRFVEGEAGQVRGAIFGGPLTLSAFNNVNICQ